MTKELDGLRDQIEKLRVSEPPLPPAPPPAAHLTVTTSDTSAPQPVRAGLAAYVRQPALWFAVSGWGLAIVLLFRRKTI
jgi:hypothetical protein